MTGTKATIKRLVDTFRKNIRDLKSPTTLEATVRNEFINHFWSALGWDVENSKGRSYAEKDVVLEPLVETLERMKARSRRPDYIFRIDGFNKFVVEAKKPSEDLRNNRDHIFQTKTYAWSAGIPFAILTDFEEFRLFDCTLKPDYNDPGRGVVTDFDIAFGDYFENWGELTATFGRDAVAKDSLERLLAKLKNLPGGRRVRTVDRMLIEMRGSAPVDQDFLDFLEGYRRRFAQDIYAHNRARFADADTRPGVANLTEAVQRIMDRLVFLRVCEDRDITEYGELRELLDQASKERQDFYRLLVSLFQAKDHQFNGYLFKTHFTEELAVSDGLLSDFVRDLYPPNSPYRLDAIGDDILGVVYEKFLGNVVVIRKAHAEVDAKPEVRHAGGVYYTPRFVVAAIVQLVVGSKVADLPPEEVLKIKILDPACGSGSFLVAAYQFLIDHCTRYIAAHPAAASVRLSSRERKPTRIAFKSDGEWHLTLGFRTRLLTECIHGIDIDGQAVEVTAMSLYLKLVEDRATMSQDGILFEGAILPPMDKNIKCGNSLISRADLDAWWDEKEGGLFRGDVDTTFRINHFDWGSKTKGFGHALEGRDGFDCVIGNPPYIRVQELTRWAPEEAAFYKWNYDSAEKGNFDIYTVFVEQSLGLLSKDGLLGFIMPHKFWQGAYGAELRKIVAKGRHLQRVINFGHEQVFRGATTYTAIHVFGKASNRRQVSVASVSPLLDGFVQGIAAVSGTASEGVEVFSVPHPEGDAPWSLVPPRTAADLAGLRSASDLTLGDIADRMFQGIRTSMNDVFVLEAVDGKKGRYHSKALQVDVPMEPNLLKPFLGGRDIRRYLVRATNKVVLLPYENAVLIPVEDIEERLPKTWRYLKDCEPVLRRRERGKLDNKSWYGFGRLQNLDLFGIPRLLLPDMMERGAFALDESGETAFVSGYGIILKPKYADLLVYTLGLLNSTPLSEFLRSVSTPLRGGWFRPFPQFLKEVPVVVPKGPTQRRKADRIVEAVQAITRANERLDDSDLADRERENLEREVEANEGRIDDAVAALYGLKSNPR